MRIIPKRFSWLILISLCFPEIKLLGQTGIFQGGIESGLSVNQSINGACQSLTPNIYSGGIEQGFSFKLLNNVTCVASLASIFVGGTENGDHFSALKSQNCNAETSNPFSGGISESNLFSNLISSPCSTLSETPFNGGVSSNNIFGSKIVSPCANESFNPFNGGISGNQLFSGYIKESCQFLSENIFAGGIGTGYDFELKSNADCYFTNATISSIPQSACPGSTIVINGSGFLGVTSVVFNGINSPSFTINSSYSILAVVPSNATTGNISVTTSAGSSNSSGALTILTLPKVTISSSNPISLCAGPVQLKATTTETNLVWSTNQTTSSITVNQPGSYWVTVTGSNGCKATSDTIKVTPATPPVATFTYSNINVLTFQFSNNSLNAKSYSWDFGNGAGSSDKNPSIAYDTPGTYYVKLIAQNDCGKDTFETEITILPTSLQDGKNTEVFVYPNPFSDNLSLKIKGDHPGILTISFFDITGKLLSRQQINPSEEGSMIELMGLPEGMYNLQIRSEKGILNRKLMRIGLH